MADDVDPATADRLSELQAVLEDVSERLGDISMDLVRSAIDQGTQRPPADKTITRIRRSVDKAVHLLDGIGSPSGL